MFSEYSPGALGQIVTLHAEWYARHWGFGAVFEAQVAAGIGDFVQSLPHPDSRLFIECDGGRVLGAIALDGREAPVARIRWFIVAESARGGLGRRLLGAALDFARERRFERVWLSTFAGLHAARRLYEQSGFVLDRDVPDTGYGVPVTAQYFSLTI